MSALRSPSRRAGERYRTILYRTKGKEMIRERKTAIQTSETKALSGLVTIRETFGGNRSCCILFRKRTVNELSDGHGKTK